MSTSSDLIRENNELRSRLDLAEKWMRREVAGSIKKIQLDHAKSRSRRSIKNLLETEWLDMITARVIDRFGDILEQAPLYTLERLIDAEIYWQTLQQYPQMDALPIALAYQKILDAWIEERLVAPWREKMKDSRFQIQDATLDRDTANILTKKYTLSIGRLFQIISLIHDWETCSPIVQSLISYWQREIPNTWDILASDDFFVSFSELISLEVFSTKRHEKKVSYSDAKILRTILYWNVWKVWFLKMIVSKK